MQESVPQQLRYSGYWYDSELGWYWLTVRSYDPALERFLQPDPSEIEGLFSYVYAADDPTDYYDPSGLETQIVNSDKTMDNEDDAAGVAEDAGEGGRQVAGLQGARTNQCASQEPLVSSGLTKSYTSVTTSRCTIDVRFKPVTLGGIPTSKYHAFILVHDSSSITYYRGGPGGIDLTDWRNWIYVDSAYGHIFAQGAPYDQKAKDWNPDWRSLPGLPSYQTSAPCSYWNTIFTGLVAAINDAAIPYRPFTQNSNSTVYSLLYYAGLNPPTTTPVPAPAWHVLLRLRFYPQ